MTFEEAKIKIAVSEGYENLEEVNIDRFPDYRLWCVSEAATLWNQSLIDRIAFLERLSENFGKKERELKVKITEQSDRIKELEDGLNSVDETLSYFESITHGTDNDLVFSERMKIKSIL
jgi:hypothetical protein